MTYQAIDTLTTDPDFQARVRACCVEQSNTYRLDERPPIVALAEEIQRGGEVEVLCFTRILGAAPGFAEAAGDPVDQAAIPDADILAGVQANWPNVAELYFPSPA